MQNKIKSDDYENYKFALPLRFLFGRKKDRFILEELQKRHPRFSNKYCIDSKLFLSKGKINADVIVMNKSKLAEYYKRLGNSVSGFAFEGMRHKWFYNKKFFLGVLGFVFSLCILVVIFETKKNIEKNRNENIQKENVENVLNLKVKTEIGEIDFEMVKAENNELLNTFFGCFSEKEGKIGNLEIILQNEKFKFLSDVKNMFPEDFSKDNRFLVSSVKYDNAVPLMNVSFDQNLKIISKEEINLKDDSIINVQSEIRNHLIINKVNLIEENRKIDDSEIIFRFAAKSIKSLFEGISEILERNHYLVSHLKVKVNQNETFFLEMTFQKSMNSEVFLDINEISHHEELFLGGFENKDVSKSEKNPAAKNLENEKKQIKKDLGLNSHYKKIGEVKKENNTTIIFYKTEEGKIIQSEIKGN